MAETTAISWTDHTFNPWIGCQKVAPGCEHCYAEAYAKRYGKAKWGPNGTRVKTSAAYWRQPIRWNREADPHRGLQFGEKRRPRVFCASLADVFEDWQGPIVGPHGLQLWRSWHLQNTRGSADRPGPQWSPLTMDDVRRDLFALIDQTPHLDWLLLTKRPENVRRMWPERPFDHNGWNGTLAGYWHQQERKLYRPNVWLGTSVSDQATADRNVPELLKCRDLCPVLFLSCEPLLGPVDLKGWGDDAPIMPDSVPQSWGEFEWPTWVPADQRQQIERFWGPGSGRSPKDWLRDHIVQHVPATGTMVTAEIDRDDWVYVTKLASQGVRGRYLHCWNNVGRVISDDGRTIYASGGIGSGWLSKFLGRDRQYHDRLNWVIVGGESGPSSCRRPMDLAWARDLRTQCRAAGVPFFAKQDSGHRSGMQGRLSDELWNTKEFPDGISRHEMV